MSEQVMVMGKVNKGMSKNSPVQGYESAWLGRWSHGGDSKELIRPRDKKTDVEGVEVLPFPLFKVSQKRDDNNTTTKLQAYHDVGSSSKMLEKERFGSSNGPIQEKTTQNLLELIRPVRIYATVDSVQRGEMNLQEEDGHKLLKMKLKGKFFGGYLDLFPNQDHYQHKGGATLQSLESSKNTEEDGPRKNESSAKTDTLEMDRRQMIHLSGSSSSSSIKGKGIKGDAAIPRTEIPDMNEEPPLTLEREDRGETSNSATQSMNVDNFVSRECKRVRLESEPDSRWVKRLKRTASDSSEHAETKSLMKNEEASLGQKGSNNKNLFLDILKSGINNLQPRNQEPDKNLNQGGREDITLLHPWIQRWCKKKTTLTDQPEGQDGSVEAENQKETEKKHFPSIAAMALMGKALSGINPYGLRKTDSLMVWNVRDLR